MHAAVCQGAEVERAGLAICECVAQSAIRVSWSWLKNGGNTMIVGTRYAMRVPRIGVSLDYKDHKVIHR